MGKDDFAAVVDRYKGHCVFCGERGKLLPWRNGQGHCVPLCEACHGLNTQRKEFMEQGGSPFEFRKLVRLAMQKVRGSGN